MVRGILFVLSGPSGVGKGTILDRLMNDFNGIKYSISVTTRKPRKDEDVILEIDIQGARQIKNKFKDTVYIFLLPPNNKELKNRLKKRNSETLESLKRRLKNADQEISEVNNYDYSIVNDQIEKTVQEIKEVIKKERSLRKE